jgi:hypothetical protein
VAQKALLSDTWFAKDQTQKGSQMGTRRDNITGKERAEIAIQVLPPSRPHGLVTELSQTYGISRQTVYNIAVAGRDLLENGMQPGPHGPRPPQKNVLVDRNRLERGTLVLTESGVSQRDVKVCLEEMLDTHISPAWVNARLSGLESKAAAVNASWQPSVGETFSGDEIYSNGSPNLLVVGNDSLYIYALTRQPSCDGDTWGCVLLDTPDCPLFSSDGGTGLAAGVNEAGQRVHQLDWDHLLRPLWGQAQRLEDQACAILEETEERIGMFDQAHTEKRLEQHFNVWQKLDTEAQEKMKKSDDFSKIAQRVDQQFALIDLETGLLRDPVRGATCLQELGAELAQWTGRIYEKLSNNLIHWAKSLFAYQPLLQQTLNPLIERSGVPAVQALSRIWQIQADQKRHPFSVKERADRQALWEKCLDQAVELLGTEQTDIAWQALSDLLGRSWRGSMLAECVNSLLRPVLSARKSTDQECLELFRFLHNVRPFLRGKRQNHSPAELVGIQLSEDPFTLLGLASKVSI